MSSSTIQILHQTSSIAPDSSSSSSPIFYDSFTQLLNFLLLRKSSNTTKTTRNWYEAVITKNVERGFLESGLAVCAIEQQVNQETGTTKKPRFFEVNQNYSSSSSSSVSSLLTVVIVENQPRFDPELNRLNVVTIVLDEKFAFEVAEHCDVLFKEVLARFKKFTSLSSGYDKEKAKEEYFAENRDFLTSLLATRLFFAPNNYRAWNIRKEMFSEKNSNSGQNILDSFYFDFDNELEFNALAFARVPKSPEAWYHRMWLMKQRIAMTKNKTLVKNNSDVKNNNNNDDKNDKNDKNDNEEEQEDDLLDLLNLESHIFARKACSFYKRCYPSWEYRRTIWMEYFCHHIGNKKFTSNDDDDKNSNDPKFQHHFFEDELRGTLRWIELNPSDGSAVSYFASLFRSAFEQRQQPQQQAPSSHFDTILLDVWNTSQRLIRSSCQVQKLDSVGNTFSIPQVSHESIWLLRRVVVDLSLLLLYISNSTKTTSFSYFSPSSSSSSLLLYRGWSIEDEIEFVSTIIEQHEEASSSSSSSSSCVVKLPLHTEDFASIDQGDFSVKFAIDYMLWLLRKVAAMK